MRKAFDLDVKDLTRFTMLIHGNFGAGKTHLLGDFLRYYKTSGQKVRFINVVGEDGYLSLANFNLGQIGETVETLKDFQEAVLEAKAEGVHALAIDGLKHFGKLVIRANCGDRLPSVGKGSDDWQKIHRDLENEITSLRHVSPIVLCASSSDRSMDQISGEISLTPDLPGRQATGVGGMFDFVFVMKAAVIGPNRIKRTLLTAPVSNTVIRARLPNPLPTELTLPDDHGAWELILKTLTEALNKESR